VEEIKEKINNITKEKLNIKTLTLIIGVLAIVALIGAVVFKSTTSENYGVLYANLDPDDAGQILTVLQEQHIPYKVEGNGTIILVPKDKIYDVRLKLAAQGIPSGKTVGFEIFEEPKMGVTQFQENVNYLRAIEGELRRTIKQIDAIQDAKVNIAIPKDTIFVREEDEAKASVIVRLAPGKDLTKEQIKAIVFLVSHAVPKLKPENVTVVDNRGRVLSDLLENEEDQVVSDKTLNLKKRLEKQIQKNVQSMLSQALGYGKVIVRATVDIDTGKLEQQDELFDPDSATVVSQRKIQENSKTYEQQQQGAPGTPTNVPPVLNINGNNNTITEKNKKDTTTNYEISKSVKHLKKNLFTIKKISVGVLIDGKYKEIKDKDGNITREFIPRSPEELKSYEELVKSAVGYNPERGDQIKVVSIPFEAPPVEAGVGEEGLLAPKNLILLAGIGLISFILILLLLVMLIKSKKKKKAEEEAAIAAAAAGAMTPEGMQGMRELHEMEEAVLSLEQEPEYMKILEIAENNPELLATLVSKWLKEEGK